MLKTFVKGFLIGVSFGIVAISFSWVFIKSIEFIYNFSKAHNLNSTESAALIYVLVCGIVWGALRAFEKF